MFLLKLTFVFDRLLLFFSSFHRFGFCLNDLFDVFGSLLLNVLMFDNELDLVRLLVVKPYALEVDGDGDEVDLYETND